jgi:hypothetical protein
VSFLLHCITPLSSLQYLYLHCSTPLSSLQHPSIFIAVPLYLHCITPLSSLHYPSIFIAVPLYLHCSTPLSSFQTDCCAVSVNYIAKAFPGVPFTHPDAPKLKVLFLYRGAIITATTVVEQIMGQQLLASRDQRERRSVWWGSYLWRRHLHLLLLQAT